MPRKKIAVLIAESQAAYQTKVLKGIMSVALMNGCDVLIYSTFTGNSAGGSFVSSEASVYSVFNPDYADGIIIFPGLISFTPASERIFRLIKASGKPVICVDGRLMDFETLIYNDELDIENITDHLIEAHGIRRINLMTGPNGRIQSMSRLNGYKKSLEKHDIPFDERRVFYGDFWTHSAESCLDYYDSNGISDAQAIVCGNDAMAVTLIKALEKRGKRVPEDIAVTGYDCEGSNVCEKYLVTSARMNTIRLGRQAAKIILAKINKTPYSTDFDGEAASLVMAGSCGCERNIQEYADEKTCGTLMAASDNCMLDELIDVPTISDFLWKVDEYTKLVKGYSHLSICLSDDWMRQYENFNGDPFTDRICWIYTDITGERHGESVDTHRFIRKNELFPYIDSCGRAAAYYFLPIHSNRCSFGYCVLSYGMMPEVYGVDFAMWAKYIGNALESLRRYINQVNLNDQNSLLSKEMIKTQEEVILAFAEITESKSGQTGKHIKRVSEYSRILAQGMGFDAKQTEQLRIASMLHDVGKLLIPSEILEKPGKLTNEEFDVIKTHVTIGEQLLHNAPGEIMAVARTVALYHHEKWNGRGYLGLSGDSIDKCSQIVAVADVFDALSSKRSYKDAWSADKVYELITSERGEHFSPSVVDVFISRYNEIAEVTNAYPD